MLLLLQWSGVTALAHALCVLMGYGLAPFGALGIALTLVLAPCVISFAQWLILHRYLASIPSYAWIWSSLQGLFTGMGIIVATGVVCALLLFVSRSTSGGDYMPYGTTMLLTSFLTVYVIGGWCLLWGTLAQAQWRVLLPHIAAPHADRRSWIIINVLAGTVAGVVGFSLFIIFTKRMYGTSGPLDTSSVMPAIVALIGIAVGGVSGIISGFAVKRLLQDHVHTTNT